MLLQVVTERIRRVRASKFRTIHSQGIPEGPWVAPWCDVVSKEQTRRIHDTAVSTGETYDKQSCEILPLRVIKAE